ncbi:hypothetical protein TNCV_2184101 [Trichonephila clavipes]|nr:hypothetical protein TNCV_2184101 [Trichonephila clavipes]
MRGLRSCTLRRWVLVYQLSSCEPFSTAAGGYNFVFLVTRITFTCSEMDITLRKLSKIITPNEHISMAVRDIATIADVGNSSVSRILRTFQDSGTSKKKKKMWAQTENYSKTRNSKTRQEQFAISNKK